MYGIKWFVVRKPSTGEIIATIANRIVPPALDTSWKYKNVARLKEGLGMRLRSHIPTRLLYALLFFK